MSNSHQKSIYDTELVRRSNFHAKKELLRNDYASVIDNRKNKTKNELKGLRKSIFIRQLRKHKLKSDELEILNKDKEELKENFSHYRQDKKNKRQEYKENTKTAKQESKEALKEIREKRILIDSYGDAHHLLEFEKNNPREIANVISNFNRDLAKNRKSMEIDARKKLTEIIPDSIDVPSTWKSYLLKFIHKNIIARFTYNFLSPYEDKAHSISLKVKEARINSKETKSALKEILMVLRERSDELNTLTKKAKAFTVVDEEKLKSGIQNLNQKKKTRLNQIMMQKKSGLLTKKSLKENRTKINKETKNEIELLKLKNAKYALGKAREYYNRRVSDIIKKNQSIIDSSISDARMATPVVVSKEKKYLLTALGALIPGLPQMFLGQAKKGFIMMTIFIPLLIISWLFTFGVIGYQGNGIVGLSLGEQTFNANLTASYLVEGVIAIVFLVVVIAVMFGSMYHTWKQAQAEHMGTRTYDWTRTRNYLKQAGLPYALGLPAIIMTIFIVAVPILASLIVLFTNYDTNSKFGNGDVPLEYSTDYLQDLFSGQFADAFGAVMGWTVGWTFGATFMVVFLGVVVALLANHKKVRAKGFWRLIYLLPWAIPGFITIMFFNIANSPGGELDRLFVDWFNFSPGALKNDTQLTRIWLIFMQGWLGHSYIFLLITSGLQSISKDLYEAARMDGASTFRQLWRITTPIVLYQVAPLMVGQFAFNFGNFTAIYLYAGGGPSPSGEVLALGLGQTDILATVTFKLIQGANTKEALAAAFTFFGSLIVIIPTAIGLFRTRVFRKGKL